MIRDSRARAVITQDWAGVEKLSKADDGYFYLDVFVSGTRLDESYNLPFLLAYSVLDQVLTELRQQGEFQCTSWFLGAKMSASRDHLPWKDYDLADSGREARNLLAHEAVLLSKADCLKYIDAVRAELKAWAVI